MWSMPRDAPPQSHSADQSRTFLLWAERDQRKVPIDDEALPALLRFREPGGLSAALPFQCPARVLRRDNCSPEGQNNASPHPQFHGLHRTPPLHIRATGWHNRSASGQICKEKMMIHDDQIRFRRALVHERDETSLELRAFLTCAGFTASIDPRPQLAGIGKILQFRPVASLRLGFPLPDAIVLVDLFHPAQYGLLLKVIEFLSAQVILPAFH